MVLESLPRRQLAGLKGDMWAAPTELASLIISIEESYPHRWETRLSQISYRRQQHRVSGGNGPRRRGHSARAALPPKPHGVTSAVRTGHSSGEPARAQGEGLQTPRLPAGGRSNTCGRLPTCRASCALDGRNTAMPAGHSLLPTWSIASGRAASARGGGARRPPPKAGPARSSRPAEDSHP